MTREELEHAIRSACEVSGDTDLWIFESQSILGQIPNASPELRFSMELDVDPRNRPENVDRIDGALGEGSQFHRTFGFYVHGVSIETAALPDGWRERTITIENVNTRGYRGHCLDVHDLAASKLAANRDKDREFVRTLLREGLVDAPHLARLLDSIPRPREERERLQRWVRRTAAELDGR